MLASEPRAVSVERRIASTHVVANHVSHLVVTDRAVANQVFQRTAVDRHDAITDTQPGHTRSQRH